MNKIRVGIAGGTGYTGGELIRLLLQHPEAELTWIQSRSRGGQPVHSVHSDLLGDTDLLFCSEPQDADVIFLCLPHGESAAWMKEFSDRFKAKIIDLGNDHRMGRNGFVYGLPEINRDHIRTAQRIANPGCFATAIQLALLPLLKNGFSGDAHITGITGSTGAGSALQETTHFSWRNSNISAYKTFTHQHLAEIGNTFETHFGQCPNIRFVPWRGDFTRGIFISAMLPYSGSADELQKLYTEFYRDAAFTHVSDSAIHLKQAVNTNKAIIQTELSGSDAAIHCAIDNLLKGASGQAVQNMNLMFGLNENTGLMLKASAF